MNPHPLIVANLPSTEVLFRVDLFLTDLDLLDGREPGWVTMASQRAHDRAVTEAKWWLAERPESFSQARVVKVTTAVDNETVDTLTPA